MIYVIIILAVLLAAAIIAGVYFWKQSKNFWDLYKQEEKKRWDEISRSAGLENEIGKLRTDYKNACEAVGKLIFEKDQLQDRLSKIICPTNNHVWQDGVCKKCGRAYNG